MVGVVTPDGWLRVRWDSSTSTNSYRMGREGKYDLALAPSEFAPKASKEKKDEPPAAELTVG